MLVTRQVAMLTHSVNSPLHVECTIHSTGYSQQVDPLYLRVRCIPRLERKHKQRR